LVPAQGQWPVAPQQDVDVSHDRIWIDGCFDFSHHGHAGAMLQARQLGTELLVGVHSDEAIMENKGPTVMRLDERCAVVPRSRACAG
jgi:ethanolamine-phosphate cytidylyltransferase